MKTQFVILSVEPCHPERQRRIFGDITMKKRLVILSVERRIFGDITKE